MSAARVSVILRDMNQALQIGPLSLPYTVLLTLVAIALGGFVAHRLARAADIEVEPTLTYMLLVGLLAARLAFVLRWRDQYFDVPLSILNIRDGGWEPAAGVLVALLFGLQRAHRRAGLRKPVLAAAFTTGTVLLLGGIATFMMAPSAAPLPSLTLSSLEGRSVSLADFAGKPTVVNLWATWCPPCRREMPALQQVQAANPDVNIVFVNQGEEAATIVAFLDRHGLALRNVLVDPQNSTGAALSHSALPTTLFFDATGRLASTRIGELSQATLTQRLASLRTASPPTR
ncbi:MAG: redoxin family protein [Gammaproteobacteria bacterium]|nr:redoxin family protein [Gammaproteobacteria bacterium]